MDKLINDLTRLHTDLIQGGDGGAFDIAGLAEEAIEAIEKLLKDIDIKLKALTKAEEALATYRQKAAGGLLVELPCPDGTDIWYLLRNCSQGKTLIYPDKYKIGATEYCHTGEKSEDNNG